MTHSKKQAPPARQLTSWGQLKLYSSAERLLADQRNPETMVAIMHREACLLYRHVRLPQNKTNLLRDTEKKHELIYVLVVSSILNPGQAQERLCVFINRQEKTKKAQRERSTEHDRNHMELMVSNSSCDST